MAKKEKKEKKKREEHIVMLKAQEEGRMEAIEGGDDEAVRPWVWLCGLVRVTAWGVEGGSGEALLCGCGCGRESD